MRLLRKVYGGLVSEEIYRAVRGSLVSRKEPDAKGKSEQNRRICGWH
jgi:hypothetical protein